MTHKPGVYLMKDRFGTVIYVGKARDLRKRVSVYFHPSRRMGWGLKFNALIDAVHDLDTYMVKSEPEALLLEGRLIKDYQPRYNISFRDDKRFLLIKINLNDPIPRFTLARLRQDDCGAPCIDNVSQDEYRRQAAAACDFLDGQTDEMVRELEGQMKRFAAAED